MVPVLLEAIKEQQKTIEGMEADNTCVKAENVQMKMKIDHLYSKMEKIEAILGVKAEK